MVLVRADVSLINSLVQIKFLVSRKVVREPQAHECRYPASQSNSSRSKLRLSQLKLNDN